MKLFLNIFKGKSKANKVTQPENVKPMLYSMMDICPCCGEYSVDGGVCIKCQKEYGLYKPTNIYIE